MLWVFQFSVIFVDVLVSISSCCIYCVILFQTHLAGIKCFNVHRRVML